jgi:LacI family repressor for deo operon, udp, cdd, tsx, nupC, and nupG
MTGRNRRRGPPKTGAATIIDVAKVAGVSTATVSRAIARPEMVSSRTREIVAAAARSVGYLPGAAGPISRPRATGRVLAVIPRMGSPFFTPFLDTVSDILSEAGFCVVVSDILGSTKKEANIARQLDRSGFDGVIVFTGRIPEDVPIATSRPALPLVLVCNDIPGLQDVPVFDVANRDAARYLVSYLISIGHRRIAHIRGPEGNIEAAERLEGYREALRITGIMPDDDLVWHGDFYLGSGIAAAGRFLACAERPTAVFAGNDQMAMGFITELKNADVAVPADVSVVGFDDLEFSAIFDPPLTTMRQPRAELGRLAALELLQRIRGNREPAPSRVRLTCELVIRSSTRHIRQTAPEKASYATKRRAGESRASGRAKSLPTVQRRRKGT